jgi:hypothetical protein
MSNGAERSTTLDIVQLKAEITAGLVPSHCVISENDPFDYRKDIM